MMTTGDGDDAYPTRTQLIAIVVLIYNIFNYFQKYPINLDIKNKLFYVVHLKKEEEDEMMIIM
jgi:hypothetical protein